MAVTGKLQWLSVQHFGADVHVDGSVYLYALDAVSREQCLRALGVLRYSAVPDLQDLCSNEQCMVAH